MQSTWKTKDGFLELVRVILDVLCHSYVNKTLGTGVKIT